MKPHLEKNKPVAIILADKPLSSNLETIFGKQDISSLMIAGKCWHDKTPIRFKH